MRSKYYNTGKNKKSKYMNFKYHNIDLNFHEENDLVRVSKYYYDKPKLRWRRLYRLINIENRIEMTNLAKEFGLK